MTRAEELTGAQVAGLKAPGLYCVGGVPGLNLRVQDEARRSWILRVTVRGTGRRRDVGLGPYPVISLVDARKHAGFLYGKVVSGVDPVAERRHARELARAARVKVLTFKDAAKRLIASLSPGWTNELSERQWRQSLDDYAMPVLGAKHVAEIATADILQVLTPIWATKTATASRVRSRVEAVIAFADFKEGRERRNPAAWSGALEFALPAPSAVATITHHAAVPVASAPQAWASLCQDESVEAHCLRFVVLTACRSGEARGLTWAELDLEAALWAIPSGRMKARREHQVPLSPQAVALLKKMPMGKPEDLVFASVATGGLITARLLQNAMRRAELDATVHGWRSSFRDWAAEAGHPFELAEAALAHASGSAVVQAYLRSKLTEQRRPMMGAWAEFLESSVKVGAAPPVESEQF